MVDLWAHILVKVLANAATECCLFLPGVRDTWFDYGLPSATIFALFFPFIHIRNSFHYPLPSCVLTINNDINMSCSGTQALGPANSGRKAAFPPRAGGRDGRGQGQQGPSEAKREETVTT